MSDRSRDAAGSRMEPESNAVRPQLSDEQWALIQDLFKPPKQNPKGGRPRVDSRACLEGVLWVLRSGARWKDLPRCFPSYPTCWRRFVEWTTDGTLDRVHRRLVHKLYQSGRFVWEEGFADSDPLRQRLAERGVDLVCPHRKGRKRKATQDGRKLQRYRRRWKIERTIAWLHDFRRTVTRYEVDAHLYHGLPA